MAFPPIITHVFRVLPPMLLKASVVYGSLWFLQHQSPTALLIPTWLAVIASLVAIPVVSSLQGFVKEHKYNRDAALNGAMPVPILPLTAWQVIVAIRKSFTTSATPSMSYLIAHALTLRLRRSRYSGRVDGDPREHHPNVRSGSQ